MDKCYTLLCVAVFLVSVIHGFMLSYRNGNRVVIKVLEEESVMALPENNSTVNDLLVLPTAAAAAALTTCTHALDASSQQGKAAVAEFQALDAATQGQVVDDFRAQINAAVGLFRSCGLKCLSSDGLGVDEAQEEACVSALLSQAHVWADASKLLSQYRDLEINRAQLTPGVSHWWSSSSNSSSDSSIS